VATRRLTLAAVVVALIAAAVAVVVARDAPGTPEQPPPVALRGLAVLLPGAVEFGDRLEARVVAMVDPRQLDPHRLQVSQTFAPLTQLGPTRTTILTGDRVDTVTLTTPLACVEQACVGASGLQRVTLPPVRIVAPGRSSKRTVTLHWPTLSVQGRVSKAALASGAAGLRADSSPPAVTYRTSPSTLAWLLTVAAALIAAAAVVLACLELRHMRAARRAPTEDALTRALALVREAEQRPPPDRRRALDLLARVLPGDRGADTVRDLAWSEPEPQAAELSSVAERFGPENGGPA
jgi:hypothetical protein